MKSVLALNVPYNGTVYRITYFTTQIYYYHMHNDGNGSYVENKKGEHYNEKTTMFT